MAKRTYITTPIYYVNSVPHVGHALTMLACDVTKRFARQRGEEVVFLTGTDENGLKVLEAAQAAGAAPQARRFAMLPICSTSSTTYSSEPPATSTESASRRSSPA